MINEDTEIVFIDEWSVDGLNAEDAKKVLEGGLQMLPRKHKEADKFPYRSGIYITTNEMSNFGVGADAEAVERRLSIFETKSIPNPRNRLSEWLRYNAMMVFHYCANELKDEPLFSDDENGHDNNVGNEGYESDEGAKYNDYDRTDADLFRPKDILQFSSAGEQAQVDEAVPSSVVPDHMLQHVSFKLDKAYPEHWVKDHKLFDYKADINSEEYHRKMFLLANGGWQETEDFYSEDAERLKMRLNHSWKGKDTLYDAWLLSERKTHEQFDMETFLERYPKWPELWEELYGENRKFANSSQEICSAPVQNVLADEFKDPTDSQCQSPPLSPP